MIESFPASTQVSNPSRNTAVLPYFPFQHLQAYRYHCKVHFKSGPAPQIRIADRPMESKETSRATLCVCRCQYSTALTKIWNHARMTRNLFLLTHNNSLQSLLPPLLVPFRGLPLLTPTGSPRLSGIAALYSRLSAFSSRRNKSQYLTSLRHVMAKEKQPPPKPACEGIFL